MALSWPNLPCALKAAIGYGKRTLGALRQFAAPQGPQQGLRPYRAAPAPPDGPNGGVADSPDETKAAFRAAWDVGGYSPPMEE
jgi:hypothetical protein